MSIATMPGPILRGQEAPTTGLEAANRLGQWTTVEVQLGMAQWEVAFALERGRGVPLVQQIARAVTTDIRRGRLRPGDRLPGTRTLARALGVQRLTVVAAFDELVAEGWIVNQPARGAFVSNDLPDPAPRRFTSWEPPAALAERTSFDLLPAPKPERPYEVAHGSLLFAPSRPDVRLVPGTVI